MALIVFNTKVKSVREEDFEWDEESMGSNPTRPSQWTWKKKGIEATNIYEITEMSSRLTVVEDIYGKVLLVKETFEDVIKKWQEAMENEEKKEKEEAEEHESQENMDDDEC